MPEESVEPNRNLVGELLRVTGEPFPIRFPDGIALGHMHAVAAFLRCRALLEGMQALIVVGAPEGAGVLLRTMFDNYMVGRWCLADPDDGVSALLRSDVAFEDKHRKRLGLTPQLWRLERVLGPRPTSKDRLRSDEIKKRAATAMKRAGKNPQFLYDGFNAIFGPESYASAHASVRSAEGHLLREGDEIIGAGIRSASAAADEEWRLPMATALVASLATDVFTLLGVDRSELDDVAATMPGGA